MPINLPPPAKCLGRYSDGKRREVPELDGTCTLPIDHDGDCSAAGKPAGPKPAIDVFNLVAEPGFAPRDWQSACPDFSRDGGSKIPVAGGPELDRILALPRRPQPVEGSREEAELVEFMSARYRRDNPACRCAELERKCITKLLPVQAWALLEITTQRGLLGPIGVGHGKTILDLLAPLAMPGCQNAVLLVPPGLVNPQLIGDYQALGQHFHVPSLITHDKHAFTSIVPGTPRLHVFPYSRLSRPESTDYLELTLKPDLIIADEVHKLKAADTATTGRVLRYFKNHPETRFCGWSGSLTDKSIKEFAHLSALALRYGSPLPIDQETVEDWARALDPSDAPAPEGALIKMCNKGEHVLSGFHRRFVETPGIVATQSAAVKSDLVIRERVPPTTPRDVQEALNRARYEWKNPEGEDYPDALQRAAAMIQMSCGFWYRWRFPLVKGQPQSIAKILEWKMIRKEWCREVRYAIRSRKEHFDSERLARNAAERAHGDRPINDKRLPVWNSIWYPMWRDIEHEVVHETEAVWINEWLAQDAADWALEHRGIVWYGHDAFGDRVAELSKLVKYGGGSVAAKDIVKQSGAQSIIASIKAHGTGRNTLQYKFHENLVACPPPSNDEWEQLLGRTHRVGQMSDVVYADFYRHTTALARYVNKALMRAGYAGTLVGSDQKLHLGGVEAIEIEEDDEDLETPE